ncbi:MAG: C25 family cysteine peptidase, partial [Fibrobacter sp.]|nr:C25 family cysteine peptidase [Fibrobacter sp.]
MFHNSCIYKIIIFVSVCFAFGKQIEFSDPEISGSSFTVNFSVPNQPADEKTCYFAFTSDPSASFTCEIRLKNENLPCKNIASGWEGKDFLQWCSFELNSSSKIPEKTTGTIHVAFSKNIFYGIKKSRVSVSNGTIRIPTERPLAKSKSVNMPEHPFNIGVRIEIDKDGIYEIDVSQLEKLGVPINHISSKSYRLFEKGKQIPIYIPEVKEHLTSKNKIIFYGQYLRGTNRHYEQFSNTNVYWLTWGNNVIGARIAEVSGERIKDNTLYSSAGVILAQSFPDTIHFEVDDDIRWLGDISNLPTELVTSSPENFYDEDNWYWGFMGDNELTEFTIPVPAPSLDTYARLKICLMGLTSVDSIKPDHNFEILFNQNPPGTANMAIWDGQSKYIFYSETFPAKGISEGDNRVSFICSQNRDYFDKCALNWIELEYSRLYRALNNHIIFKNPPESEKNVVEYSISGFTSENIELWDIKRNRFFTKFITEKVTDLKTTTYTLVFQDSLAVNTTYLAQAVSMHMTPSCMKLDTIITNWNHILNSDYIAVSTDSFHTELQELLDAHSARGLKTQFVDIDDIYNSFSWGIKDPESIRTMLKFLFSAGTTPPRYLLLGGDTSHDLDKKNRSRNIVPTKLSRFSKWGPGANDSYFAMVSGDDNFADLVVGRFPAQNRAEMKTLVSKTVNYINNPQRGFWRDNILLLGGGEQTFTEFNDDIENNQIGLSMNAYRLDAHPESKYYKDEFTASKQIADQINSGVYIVNFNGHGGGNIWSDNNFFGYKDLSKLYNGSWGKSGKLPVIFSFT